MPGLEEEMFVATIVARESEEETAMATEVAPEPEEETVVFPDWVMLDRSGRTHSHADLDAAREAANKKKTAVEVVTSTGRRCCLSFALSDPPEVSYLDLEWPREASVKPVPPSFLPAYPYVRATDEDLVLFEISIPGQPFDLPSDLFVYTAGRTPSVDQLPLYTETIVWPFLMSKYTTGILRLPDNSYIVSDLNVYQKKKGPENYSTFVELYVFNSKTKEWKHFPEMPAPQPQGESNTQFPILWSTKEVLASGRRFLCCVDYLNGVLLCDFSNLESPVLHFVPFPGGDGYSEKLQVMPFLVSKENHEKASLAKCLAARFRRVSVSQGMMHFVRIDGWRPRLERGQGQQQPLQKITVWTLDIGDGSKFEWKIHWGIKLDLIWAQDCFHALDIPRCLPEFPVVCANNPDTLCCLLRKEELSGQPWMIMVDMNQEDLQTSSKYINQQPYNAACVNEKKPMEAHQIIFSNVPLLPTVFSEYLVRPTVIPRDNKLKLAASSSEKIMLMTGESLSLQCEFEDLKTDDPAWNFLVGHTKDGICPECHGMGMMG
ncbi:hypothetical protein ACQJBY_046352 [Aegilops geniculata]